MPPPPRRRAPIVAALVVAREGGSSTEVLDEIRRAILEGGAPPGSPIPVADVASAFGVSPTPVREALKILQGESLVQHTPRGEYAIARVSSAELHEFYIVRASLESAALTAACAAASDSDRAHATAACAALDTALAEGNSVAYHRLSRDFHMALVRPSRMMRLLHILDRAWNVTEPVQPMVHVSADHRRLLHTDHARMLDAFLRRDQAALLAVAAEHNGRLSAALSTLPDDLGLLAP